MLRFKANQQNVVSLIRRII